jgi:hypothetical protein
VPINTHLDWIEVDGKAGLWTAGAASLMPATAAQIMSGCHPQPGGGLRAFLKPTAVPTTNGLDSHHSLVVPVGYGISVKSAQDGTSAPTHLLFTVAPTTYLRFDGANTGLATSPDKAAFDITGDLTLQAQIAPTLWVAGGVQTVISNLHAASFTGYELRISNTGTLILAFGDGAAIQTRTSTAAVTFTDGTLHWIRATLDVNNGVGGHDVKFWTSQDGQTWTQLGATVTTAGVTTIAASAQSMTMGARPDTTNRYTGDLLVANVYAGIAPSITLVAVWVQSGHEVATAGSGTFTDTTGNVWTLGSTGAIVDEPTLLRDWHLWRWEQDAAATGWDNSLESQGADFAGGGSAYTTPLPSQPQFLRFKAGAFATDVFGMAAREDAAATFSAIYELDLETGDVDFYDGGISLVLSGYGVAAAVEHQARVVAASRDMVAFSAPGDQTFTEAGGGFIILSGEGWLHETTGEIREGALIAWMLSVPPGDFLAATRDGKVYNIQGDFNDPTVRELGRWTTMVPHEAVSTPNGIFFILPNNGVSALSLDGSVTNISPSISPSVWNLPNPPTGLGQLTATERFLFAPNNHTDGDLLNGPLVYDFETKAWFTATHPNEADIPNPRFMQADNNPRESGVWVVASGTLGASVDDLIFHYPTGGADDASLTTEDRAAYWLFQSAPLRHPGGRYLDIREVHIPVHAFNNNTSTLTVTIGNTTHVRTLASGRQVETFLFRERGEFLDITIYSKSNDDAVEAPMIETARIGYKAGPMRSTT